MKRTRGKVPPENDVAATETFSQSSNEVNEYDGDDGSEGEYSDDEETQPFWKEHLVAIVIAVAAAIGGHFYNQRQAFTIINDSTTKHPYVESFIRMANTSFCHSLPRHSDPHLSLMDFYVPDEHFKVLEMYYQADEAQDDMYELQEYTDVSHDPEFQCLLAQKQKITHHSTKFKGSSYHYKTPTLEQIYPDLVSSKNSKAVATDRQRKLQQPPLEFTGFAAKFVNLSPDPVLLHWDGKGGSADQNRLVGEIPPFESIGTATMPGHSFHVTSIYDSSTALQRWVVTADTALAFYEPKTTLELKRTLDKASYIKYQRQLVNQAYARDYLISSKRLWLAHFPPRSPLHFMHPASFIGQTHRVGDFTLRVISVAPRALLIDNFLTPEDCRDLVALSQEQGLQLSTLHTGATAKQTRDLSTRSSSNTWLPRDSNVLTEKIYAQAAEVMQLDPELFQKFHETSAHHHSIAESLQVVRYKANGEEYQPHHDFVYPSINHRYHPTRFATLLIYLNDVPQGGETRFPRALNNHNARGLEIKPKVGQAVLFYNMLEDGNLDDLSQHGSNPTDGHEKWLANLWVWNPIIG